MAYDKDELEIQALEAIEKHKLFFAEDVIAYLPCSSATYYNHKLEQLESIKTALQNNKITTKVSMRSKWYKSDNATLQMGLMKLIGTEEEAHRLNGSSQKLNVKADVLNYTDEEREKRIKELLKKNAE